MIFSVVFSRESKPHWCFIITEKMKNLDSVMAVSVDLAKATLFDEVFDIPVDSFRESNFLIFSKKEKIYSEYLVTKEKISEKFQTILNKVVLQLSIT